MKSVILITTVVIKFLLAAKIHGNTHRCQKIYDNSDWNDRNTIITTSLKTLKGIWLSDECENRPGPQYILRHYSFDVDGKMKLIQHHYWDHSCTSPKYTLTVTGALKTKRSILLNPGALIGYSKISNFTVIFHDLNASKEIENTIKQSCPDYPKISFKQYKEYPVYRSNLQEKIFYQTRLKGYSHDYINYLKCLGALQWSFDEIKLLRAQLRPNSIVTSNNVGEVHWELLLGDIPTRTGLLPNYIPTGFQSPLYKVSQNEKLNINGKKYAVNYTCKICQTLTSNHQVPPHLIEKLQLPPYIWGEWISERCEIRPLGLYLKRKFTFHNNFHWIGEHRFYADQFCQKSKFTITASGDFTLEEVDELVNEASDINLLVENATLVIYDKEMADSMLSGNCGTSAWRVGMAQELGQTNGCPQLGLKIPSVYYDIVKIEISYEGLWMLYMGQADTENFSRAATERATSFQPPLLKCGYSSSVFLEYLSSQNSNRKSLKSFCVHFALLMLLEFAVFK